MVYFCMSWRTLRRHSLYDLKDEVEAVEGGEEFDLQDRHDPYMTSMSLSMSSLANSREYLVPVEKVKG